MGQDASSFPQISIGDHTLEVINNLTYLGSKISSHPSLDAELNVCIGKPATAMARCAKSVWGNTMLMTNTKMSTLLHRREAWTLYSLEECRLSAFIASDDFRASPGKIALPTRMSWLRKGC